VAAGVAIGLPALADELADTAVKSKVVLIRRADAVAADGTVNATVVQEMLDTAVMQIWGEETPVACWRKFIRKDDVVGIKSNEWRRLPTPPEVEAAIKQRVLDVGVAPENIDVDDQSVLDRPVFQRATALINVRPMRSHAWAGVGSLVKNYIMFDPEPPKYHPDSCADLGALWELPIVKGKTRLNILVMLTPQFHCAGPHHFDPIYVWNYGGLIVSTDPVAADSIGLQIIQAKRRAYFGEDRPLSPSAHHIMIADKKFHLGASEPERIELVRIGLQEGSLI